MFVNVSYDNPYNRDLAKKFISNQLVSPNAYEPDEIPRPPMIGGNMYSRQIGGKRPYVNEGVYDRKSKDELLPGTSAGYPQYNSSELMMVDALGSNNQLPYIEKVEGGSFKSFLKKTGKVLKKTGEVLKPIAKPIISAGLDVGAPLAGKYLGSMVGQPALGATVANIARKELKKQTGYGVKSGGQKSALGSNLMESLGQKKGKGVKSGGIAMYEGSGIKSGGMSGVRSGGGVKSGGATDKRKKRGEMIKKVMKEKGMNLAQASKYIKENNLV